MYKIKVGNFTLSGEFSEMEAYRIACRIRHCVKHEVLIIPVRPGVTV